MVKRKKERESPEKPVKVLRKEKSVVGGLEITEANLKPFVEEVKKLLQASSTLLAGLTRLRDAFRSSCNGELQREFIRGNSQCPELFKVLDKGKQQDNQLELQMALEVLECILLSTAESDNSRVGLHLVQRIIRNNLKLLYSCLNPGNTPKMVKAVLRLLVAMVTQGGAAAREVQSTFDFTLKALGVLPHKRDAKDAQDVRTCFIHFLLSFFMFGDDSVIRNILGLKKLIHPIFKGLVSDTPQLVHLVISTIRQKVVLNTAVPKKTKVQFFNPVALSQLMGLYQYTYAEGGAEASVREAVDAILQDVCCTFKYGICFANSQGMLAKRSNNPMLLQFLQSLPKTLSGQHTQDLVVKILTCCPDLVNPYLSSMSITYEPRLSLPWITNMRFLVKLFKSLPLPSVMLSRCEMELETSIVPSLLSAVIPCGITRTILSHGVQHSSPNVKHQSLQVLLLILERSLDVVDVIQNHSKSHQSNKKAPLQLFREELLKRIPDVMILISLRQNIMQGKTKSNPTGDNQGGEQNGGDLLTQEVPSNAILSQALQAMFLYQELEPSVLTGVGFDLTKLLSECENVPPEIQDLTLKVLLMSQPGVCRWYQQNKKSPSCIHQVLKILLGAANQQTRDLAKRVIMKFLQDSELLGKDSNEMDIWLNHLTSQEYGVDKEVVLMFLDEVCSSLAAEPYTYIDVMTEAVSQAAERQAMGQTGIIMATHDSPVAGSRHSFSSLVVAALQIHRQAVLKATDNATLNDHLVNHRSIAAYINLVVLDILRSMIDPLPICIVVNRYYSNLTNVSSCPTLTTLHQSLLKHARYWSGEDNEDFPIEADAGTNALKSLEKAISGEKGENFSPESLFNLLASLTEPDLRGALSACLRYSTSHMDGNLGPIATHLTLKPYCVTGSCPIKELLPLLKVLPFNVLLWQLFSPSAPQTTVNKRRKSDSAKSKSLLENSKVQQILFVAMEKNEGKAFGSTFRFILLLMSQLVKSSLNPTMMATESTHTTAIDLLFRLLKAVIQKSLEISGKLLKDKDEMENDVETPAEDIGKANVQENQETDQGLDVGSRDKAFSSLSSENHVQDVLSSLHHPLLIRCFLSPDAPAVMSERTAELITVTQQSLPTHRCKHVIAPFMVKLCDVIIDDCLQPLLSSGSRVYQALELLPRFHAFCDKIKVSALVTRLLQLPIETLVTKTSGDLVPSLYYHSLLALLNAEWDVLSSILTTSNVEKLLELVIIAPCADIDRRVCGIISGSAHYALLANTALLDFCVDHPTDDRVAMASTLIQSSPCLRTHFERRCLATSKKGGSGDKRAIRFKKLALRLLPLVCVYLRWSAVVANQRKILSFKDPESAVSGLVAVYLPQLWQWLHKATDDKKNEEHWISLLESLIRLQVIDEPVLRDQFDLLADLTRGQAWVPNQLKAAIMLYQALSDQSDNSQLLTMEFVGAVMANISRLLSSSIVTDNLLEESFNLLVEILNKAQELPISLDVKISDTLNAFVKDSLRHKFDDEIALRSLALCIRLGLISHVKSMTTYAMPLTSLYQLILSHSLFLDVMFGSTTLLKESLLDLLVAIVERSPESCDQAHLAVLFASYSASLSKTDQQIIYLLHLYEKSEVSLTPYRPYVWGKAALDYHKTRKTQPGTLWQQPSTGEVMELLDAQQTYRSAVDFPIDRKLQPQVQDTIINNDIYDPCFLLPLFTHLFASNSEIDGRKFIECGGLGFTLAAMSSRDERMRRAAGQVLMRYLAHVEGAGFRERKQIQLLLECFRDGLTDACARVPCVVTRFVARASHVLLRPDHSFYMLINSFLLSRPAIDPREIPMFYTLFNSSSMQHRNEQSWMLQLLVEGMRDSQDYYIYKKRHAIELALSFHDSQLSDQQSRVLVTSLLSAILAVQVASFDCAKNYGVVSWLNCLALQSGRESLETTLHLLQTMWETMQKGTQGACTEGSDADRKTPYPPHFAEESLLVCKTLIGGFRSGASVQITCSLIHLVRLVLGHLSLSGTQGAHILELDVFALVTLWCQAFNVADPIYDLEQEYELHSFGDKDKPIPITDAKQASFNELVRILTLWEPISHQSKSVLQLSAFVLRNLEIHPCPSVDIPLYQELVTWLKCQLRHSHVMIDALLSCDGDYSIRSLLRMYHFATTGSHFDLINELNAVFVILLKRLQGRHDDVTLGQNNCDDFTLGQNSCDDVTLGQNSCDDVTLGQVARGIIALLSSGVYKQMLSSGFLNLLSYKDAPRDNDIATDRAMVEMISVLLQELWINQTLPHQFLSRLHHLDKCSNESDSISKLVHSLGGKAQIETWLEM
ncbi:nucleolar pre-ribosomal-associated protein 1 isoform X2 [Nematostella vectensis]|uniref:nucleolar pre-ribosomal-associated protein 1 isoform X2 n=1 Tax=Nematostella vectensis TaxID=45351 RepID=UPI0020777460|nr:nucleolar pre-ribosomal-associated protein 1 isoform X2 [Nematostella vectensis]